MKRNLVLTHEFVEYIPNDLKDGTIYVSVAFATAAHKCCCGCGYEVVTPLSPTDWKLIFDGRSISLDPSIGNWSFACQSHYWIRQNKVVWARRWSRKKVEAGRAYDRLAKAIYFATGRTANSIDRKSNYGGSGKSKSKESLWRKLRQWWF